MKSYGISKEKTEAGNKVVFTIPSLDKEDIQTRYRTVKRAVKGVSRKIKSFEKEYTKAFEISGQYARDYCFNDFEIKYAGKESDIFLQTLQTVQDDLNKKRNDNRISKKIIKNGVLAAIPGVGEVAAYKSLKKAGSVLGLYTLSVASILRGLSIPLLLSGKLEQSAWLYGSGTAMPFVGNLINTFDNIEEIEKSREFDVGTYYTKKPVASTA